MSNWKILLLRHGKSSWADPDLADYDRPLKPRGWRDSLRMGQFLKEEHLIPRRIHCSSAQRTRQTVSRLCEGLEGCHPEIEFRDDLYHADWDNMYRIIKEQNDEDSPVLMIGHNPGLEALVEHLVAETPQPADGKLIPTATLVELTAPVPFSEWRAGDITLRRITRPRALST